MSSGGLFSRVLEALQRPDLHHAAGWPGLEHLLLASERANPFAGLVADFWFTLIFISPDKMWAARGGDPRDERDEEYLEWRGEFNPKRFDLEEVSREPREVVRQFGR